MNARLKRWLVRVWGALSMTYIVGVALRLIAATLISNMDRVWAASTCVAIVVAGVTCLRWMKQTTFGAASPESALPAGAEASAAAADAEMADVVVKMLMRDDAAMISREALEHLTGASEKEMWL
jgi:hypothetical protein